MGVTSAASKTLDNEKAAVKVPSASVYVKNLWLESQLERDLQPAFCAQKDFLSPKMESMECIILLHHKLF